MAQIDFMSFLLGLLVSVGGFSLLMVRDAMRPRSGRRAN